MNYNDKANRLSATYETLFKLFLDEIKRAENELESELKDLKNESRTDEVFEEKINRFRRVSKRFEKSLLDVEKAEDEREIMEPAIQATVGKTLYLPAETAEKFGFEYYGNEPVELQKTSQDLREAYVQKYGRRKDDLPAVSEDILTIVKLPAFFILVRGEEDDFLAPGHFRIKSASYY